MGTGGLTGVDTTTPAVVVKFDHNVMHHGALGAIRSLGRLGVPVYGVHEGPWAPAANSAYLRGRWFWRPDPADPARVRAGLLALAERIGQTSVLLATDDAGAIFLAEHGDPLRQAFRFPDPPPGLPRALAGKDTLPRACHGAGVSCPLSAVAESSRQAREFAASAGFPLVAKLAAPWSAGASGLRSTRVLSGPGELGALQAECERRGAGLLLQEFVPAAPGDDWFVHAYWGAGSACRPVFTGVKERSYPPGAGLTSFGRSARNTALRDQAAALLSRLSYRGAADLDLRRDARDGRYKLLDFNPRLGAQFRVFADGAGIDVVRAAYLDLTGQAAGCGPQVDGRVFLVENYDPLSALSRWRGRQLGLRNWLASLREADELAWFARDDLRPFGLMCLRMGWRAVTGPAGRPGAGARGRPARSTPEPVYRQGRAKGRAAARAGPGPGPHVGEESALSRQEENA